MDLRPMGRGGARRRTRRRMAVVNSAAQSNQQPAAAPASAPTGTDPASLIQMLNALHTAGVLNDEELNQKKLQVTELM